MEKTKEQKKLEESFKRLEDFLKPEEKNPRNPFEEIFKDGFKGMKKPEK
ncbi:MAG: hypothetical protein M0R48_11835 [Candidatus Omnitrophica bacterium]|jgi:hypothetical protein|nr:hypothetical protein [Candidatus Omnitrophota bacterium]